MGLGRYRLFYLLYFIGMGTYQPFMNLYFKRLGLSGSQLGLLASLTPLAVLVVPPFVGAWVDLHSNKRSALLSVLVGSVLVFSAYFGVQQFASILLVTLLFALINSPLVPLADAATLDQLERSGGDYSRVRVFGSLGFAVGAILSGRVLQQAGPASFLWVYVGALSAATLAASTWPRYRTTPTVAVRRANAPPPPADSNGAAKPTSAGEADPSKPVGLLTAWKHVLGQRPVLLLLIALFISRLSAVVYYNFFSIYLDERGIAEGAIGLAWALGIGSEVVVMNLIPAMVRRWGSRRVILISFVASVIRWTAYAHISGWMIYANQLLHGFTFACFWVGSVAYVNEVTEPRWRASSQSILAAVSNGLAPGVGVLLAGELYQRLGRVTPLFDWAGAVAAIALVFFATMLAHEARKAKACA
ncbi:MAG: MFS transporter [Limnochordaceae bacterium]|nr:MFS transporter [Limnochordaceae bacterium]